MGLELYDVTCEYQKSAIGINTDHPVFSWKYSGAESGCYQEAYRISVTDLEGNVLADTEKMPSDRQTGIELDLTGKLLPFTKYTFEVECWVKSAESTSLAPSHLKYCDFFITGVFKAHQWKGMWFGKVWAHYGNVGFYRKEFQVSEDEIDYAYFFLACVGEKAPSASGYLNGTRIDESPIFPGATESFRAFYHGIDVKKHLCAGTNTLGLTVLKRASCILKIRYKNGQEQTEYADYATWKYKPLGPYKQLGYTTSRHRGKIEVYDARNAFVNWNKNGFDDSDWTQFEAASWGITWSPLFITPQFCCAKEEKEIRPVRILPRRDENDNGNGSSCARITGYFVDFGVNLSGFVSFRLKGKIGQTITLRYAEKLTDDKNGCVYTKGYPAYCQYTFASDEVEEYCPQFVTVGFRCIEIEGFDGEVDENSFCAHFIHSDVLTASSVCCSDHALALLNEVARRSFLCNLVNIPTDCADRERRGWTADAYAVCEAECTNFNMLPFYYQWFESMRDCQRANGWIPVELPISSEICIDVNWPMACIFISWEIYRQYADDRFLRRFYDMIKRYCDLLLDLCDEEYGIADAFMSYKDWLATEKASSSFIGMAYFYRGTYLMQQIAQAIEQHDDAAYYEAAASKIREKLNHRFLHRSGNRVWYDNDTQSANAHALYFEICPEDDRSAVTQSLVDDIFKKEGVTTGFMGTMCLLDCLSENQRSDVAFYLLSNKKQGGWLYLIEQCNATTFPENFDGSGSQNHAFLGGSPSLWLYKHLAGISILKPGYRKIRIAPFVPDGISYTKATQETVCGAVVSCWERVGDTIRFNISIPVNTCAQFVWKNETVELQAGQHTICRPA